MPRQIIIYVNVVMVIFIDNEYINLPNKYSHVVYKVK
jgi:hypothetical protein